MLPLLNQLWNKVEGLLNLQGDAYINVNRIANGTGVTLNIEAVRRKIARTAGGGGTPVRRAKVTQDAPSGSTITANLFDAVTGVEATSGDEFNITVYYNISNGSALNSATPRLEDNDEITVYQAAYSSSVTRWYCTANFQTTEDCVCS